MASVYLLLKNVTFYSFPSLLELYSANKQLTINLLLHAITVAMRKHIFGLKHSEN